MNYNSPAWAGKLIDGLAPAKPYDPASKPWRKSGSLRSQRELILNHFRAQKPLPGGVLEGWNNQAKVTGKFL